MRLPITQVLLTPVKPANDLKVALFDRVQRSRIEDAQTQEQN
jgi:hypothetical protein